MSHMDHTPEVPEQPDEWHMHAPVEGLPQEEHGSTVNTALLTLAFIGTVVSIALVVVLTYLYFSAYTTNLRRLRIETTVLAEDYLRYRTESDQVLHDYAWVTVEGEGVVSLPLGIAMERVLERYAQQQQEGREQEGTEGGPR
jgi:hypothetical protein